MRSTQQFTLPGPHGITKDAELDSTRSLALQTFPVELLQRLDSQKLSVLQRILRHGDQFGVWVTPREWAVPGTKGALLSVDLRSCIALQLRKHYRNCISDLEAVSLGKYLDQAVLILMRFLLLLRLGPSGMGRGQGRPLDVSTIFLVAYWSGPALLARAIAKHVSDQIHLDPTIAGLRVELPLLHAVEIADLATLSKRCRDAVLVECRRMEMLAGKELWWDVPNLTAPSPVTAMTGPAQSNEEPDDRDSHLPLPDNYVAEMGGKSVWLMRDLAPNLVTIAKKMAQVWEDTVSQGWAPTTLSEKRANGVEEILAAHLWLDSHGRAFHSLPFPLRLARSNQKKKQLKEEELRWPPQNYREFKGLVNVVQTAHCFIVTLSMGPRRSETLGLQRDCVVYASDGRTYANGKTYKLVQRFEGKWRDWFLPDTAVDAIEQQVRLVTAVERVAYLGLRPTPAAGPQDASIAARKHLWAQLSASPKSNATEPLNNLNQALHSYARALLMDTAPGGQNLRSHRFRKTLARLVALALTQAPMILMEIFWHRCIEMTLYYILTDKDLRAEIETVSRELRVMRAKEVVEKMVEADLAPDEMDSAELGGYGGLAAESIHNAINTHRQRLHRAGSDWGAESAFELAELLTLQGEAWEQVRAGVICTKLPGEAGPCNKSKGRPEPSKCSSRCDHRLEETFLREDVDGAIGDCLTSYLKAIADEESLTAAHWAAQIRAHVPRFTDLRNKWMQNATVQALMTEHKVAA